MRTTWPEKLAFTMHRYAWYLIQWSVKRRLRKLPLDPRRTLASWQEPKWIAYRNEVCMECFEGDLQLARELLYEQQESRRMWLAARSIRERVDEAYLQR